MVNRLDLFFFVVLVAGRLVLPRLCLSCTVSWLFFAVVRLCSIARGEANRAADTLPPALRACPWPRGFIAHASYTQPTTGVRSARDACSALSTDAAACAHALPRQTAWPATASLGLMTSASPEGPHPPPVYGVWSSRASTPTAPGIRDIWTAMDLPPRRPRLARPPRRKQPAAQHPVLQNRAPGPRRPSPSPPWPPTAPTSSEVTATRDTGYGTLTAARHAADMDGVDVGRDLMPCPAGESTASWVDG